MDAEEGATIVIGHNAKNKKEVESMINNKQWKSFIREIPVHKGDFFFIDSGTVHAIKGGTVILETQQSSDITYSVYHYDRLQDGKPRQLHIKQSIDVITAPFENKQPPLDLNKNIGDVKQLVSCKYFTVWYGEVNDRLKINQTMPFLLCSVIEGSCELEGKELNKGQHFILPNGYCQVEFIGNAKLIFCSIYFFKRKAYDLKCTI